MYQVIVDDTKIPEIANNFSLHIKLMNELLTAQFFYSSIEE